MKALPLIRALPPLSALPLPPLGRRLLPGGLTGLSLTLLKATALEVAILAGHLLLYPSGITQERRRPATRLPIRGRRRGSRQRPARRSCCCTAS
ncbi:hypothetical protein SGLAM104S_06563 [Streptomyces glaucescens]